MMRRSGRKYGKLGKLSAMAGMRGTAALALLAVFAKEPGRGCAADPPGPASRLGFKGGSGATKGGSVPAACWPSRSCGVAAPLCTRTAMSLLLLRTRRGARSSLEGDAGLEALPGQLLPPPPPAPLPLPSPFFRDGGEESGDTAHKLDPSTSTCGACASAPPP